jgi:hypothetical protein
VPATSKEDEYTQLIDNNLQNVGFSRYPSSERPFTYRSGKSFSTIDYTFVRNVKVDDFAVAR